MNRPLTNAELARMTERMNEEARAMGAPEIFKEEEARKMDRRMEVGTCILIGCQDPAAEDSPMCERHKREPKHPIS